MLNERKLTKSELAKREDIIMKMKKNKRALVQKYGKDAEAVMYGRATNLAKKQAEAMDQDKIKELVKDALQNPKKADLNKDGKLSDYEKKRGAAIEKSMKKQDLKEFGSSDMSVLLNSMHRELGNPTEFPGLSKIMDAAESATDFYMDDFEEYSTDRDELVMSNARAYARRYHPDFMSVAAKFIEPLDEMDLNDPVAVKMRAAKDKLSKMRAANAGDDGNDKFFDAAKLRALKKKRAQIMLDMEQEAEMEGGPIADKYGDMLNVIDAEIAKQNAMVGLEEDLDLGHEDNEPHMLKADLYRIGKYAMELYQMVDKFEYQGEVDFPHWWQSKIIKSKDMLVSAKHYLDFEIKEPQIDAMVDVAQDVEAIDEFDDKSMKAYGDAVKKAYGSTPQAMFTDYSNNELAAYCKNNPKDKAAAAELKKRSQKLKDLSRTDIKEDAIDENAIGINDRRLDDRQKSALDRAVRGDSAYSFGNDPYADDQLRYKYAVKMGFLEETKSIKEGVWSLGSINDIKAAIQTMEMGLDMDDTELEQHLQDNDAYFYNVLGDDELHDPLSRAYDQAAMGNEDRAHNELSDAIARAYDLLKMQMEKEQGSARPNTSPFGEIAEKLAQQLKSK